MDTSAISPMLTWDSGTAYDFFASLVILHDPAAFSLRPAWASGMRQRIPSVERGILEALIGRVITSPPLRWLHALAGPKTCQAALKTLGELPPVEQLLALVNASPAFTAVIQPVIAHITFDDQREPFIQVHFGYFKGKLTL